VSWFVYSLISVLFFTANNLFLRLLAVKSENPRTSSMVFNLWGALFGFLLFLIDTNFSFSFPAISLTGWFYILLVVLFYGLYERSHFYVRKEVDASTATILFRLAPVIAFFGAIYLYSEQLTLLKVLGALLIVGANILVVYKKGSVSFDKNFVLAFACSLFLGLGWLLDKRASSFTTSEFYTALIWFLPIIFIFLPFISLKDIKREFKLGSWKSPLTAFFNVYGYYLYIKALSLGEASKVTVVVSTSSSLTILAGIVILHEKSHWRLKILAGILAFVGVLLLK